LYESSASLSAQRQNLLTILLRGRDPRLGNPWSVLGILMY